MSSDRGRGDVDDIESFDNAPLSEFLNRARVDEIVAEATSARIEQPQSRSFYSLGAHFVEVRVDEQSLTTSSSGTLSSRRRNLSSFIRTRDAFSRAPSCGASLMSTSSPVLLCRDAWPPSTPLSFRMIRRSVWRCPVNNADRNCRQSRTASRMPATPACRSMRVRQLLSLRLRARASPRGFRLASSPRHRASAVDTGWRRCTCDRNIEGRLIVL